VEGKEARVREGKKKGERRVAQDSGRGPQFEKNDPPSSDG